MSDERQREISRPSLADAIDLLDLVRSSEDGARISTESPKPPAAPRSVPPPLPPVDDVVDVGDEAEDVAPSLPPTKVSLPPKTRAATPPTTPARAKPVPFTSPGPAESAMPPAVSIILLLGLAIGGLYAVLALPS